MKNPSTNQSGFITFDFIFALFLALGFTSVLFALAVSLSAVEVAQYVVFATSRAYVGAHETKDLQETTAQNKYKQLMANALLKKAFNGGWFAVTTPTLGDFSQSYSLPAGEQNTFVGAQMKIDAKLLRLQIPFLGTTSSKSTTGKATLNSYLMREVSNEECRSMTSQRFSKLQEAETAYKGAQSTKVALITDNGC